MPTKLMGVLNVTTDSYYEGSRCLKLDSAIIKAHQMQKGGAAFLDIGGCSTRPGSTSVSIEEEIKRTIPLIRILKRELNVPISIDTFQYEVAQQAVDAGVDFINDITGFTDPRMRALAKSSGLPICIMHMQKKPVTMQMNPFYPKGVSFEVFEWLQNQAQILIDLGVKKELIYLDPGIGFGKTVEDNLQILQDLDKLMERNHPILLGISRKSFIQKLTQHSAEDSLYGTLGLSGMLIDQGIDLLRVHDVGAHQDIITMVSALKRVKLNVT